MAWLGDIEINPDLRGVKKDFACNALKFDKLLNKTISKSSVVDFLLPFKLISRWYYLYSLTRFFNNELKQIEQQIAQSPYQEMSNVLALFRHLFHLKNSLPKLANIKHDELSRSFFTMRELIIKVTQQIDSLKQDLLYRSHQAIKVQLYNKPLKSSHNQLITLIGQQADKSPVNLPERIYWRYRHEDLISSTETKQENKPRITPNPNAELLKLFHLFRYHPTERLENVKESQERDALSPQKL